jgi:hypothetical protein
MAQFESDLDVRVIPGGYRLISPLVYWSDILDDYVIVPIGFVTDFASIPRVGRVLITGHGKDRWGAVVHDYLYSIGHSRKGADRVFLEALEVSGVGWLKRRAMYRAVRTGGWMFYAAD